MANQSVLELAVGTGKWDAGLKKAKQSLDNFTQANGGLQQALGKDSASMQKFVQMMGQMDSTAKTAKGQMNDYKSTIEQLTMQYNRMTDAQKQTIGRDYLNTIDQIKQKYQSVNEEIQEMNRSLNEVASSGGSGGGGGLFGENGLTGMLQVFGGNLMTKAAGAVANLGSEMYDMVQQGVELARQGEGIRIAFERLGRGDILDGLREATHGTVTDLELMKAAVKFNDFKLPVEELGTMLAFAQQKAKDTGQSVDYMVDSIVTGLGRKSLMILDNLGLSANEIKEKMKETGDMTKAVGEIIREQMSKAGDYVETAADRAAKADVELKNAMEELGRTFQPLTDASNNLWNSIKVGALNALNTAVKPLIQALAEAGTFGQGARSSAGFNNLGGNSKVDRMIGRLGNGKSAGAYSIYKQQLAEFDKYINNKRFQIAAFGGDNSSVAKSAKAKLQTELDGALKMREEYVKRAQELHNQVPSPYEQPTSSSTTNDKVGGGKTSSKSTNNVPDYSDFSKLLFKTDTDKLKYNPAEHAVASGLRPEDFLGKPEEWEKYVAAITESIGTAEESVDNLVNWTPDTEKFIKGQKKMTEAAKQNQMAMSLASQAVSAFGAAMAGMEDPGVRAAGLVMQSIASIALSFAQAAASPAVTGTGWGWLAFVAAGAAAMATTISTIHQLSGYEQGGIVKGNSYSGDNIMANGGTIGLNAGELVLTKAMQGNLASQMQGGGLQNMNIAGRIKGTDIILSIDRSLKLEGKQLLTWGR